MRRRLSAGCQWSIVSRFARMGESGWMSVHHRVGRFPVPALLVTALLSTGCMSTMQSTTGDVMSDYSTRHLIPWVLASGDTGIACETGVSMVSFLVSFERVTDPPYGAAIPTLLSAGICAQEQAYEADLASRRAIRRADVPAAKDARYLEKRFNVVAARRFLSAWEATVSMFGEPGAGCPDFETRYEELVYTLGMVSVVQALQHDMAAESRVGVPLDAPAKAARATECLNNTRWWGVPQALRAVIWVSIPGTAPEGGDPWYELDQAAAIGEKAGVRLAHAIQAQAAVGAGRDDVLKKVIEAHARSLAATPPAAEWATVDRFGTLQVQNLSDRMWTDAEGHRTPFGALGSFPESAEDDDGDDLLDGLGEETPAAEPTPPGASPAAEES